ncbi:MAG: sigma-54 dependent transcriptional regulator [Desulfotomaculaceae bacterium]|nr:sigma-54 dependent transcriptional regulator [Desulfotomaculaceae bacterium]
MKKTEVLVIDDEIEVGNFFQYYFQEEKGFPVEVANSGFTARALLRKKNYDLALVDLKLPDTDGITLMKEIRENSPGCLVIIMTGYSTVKTAVEAMKLGAFDYIDKPFDELEELDALLERALQSIHHKQSFVRDELYKLASEFSIIMADNSPLRELLLLGKKVANRNIAVLIEGETGTGKEVLARFIHANSNRYGNPFISINCGALTESLLESELFGHEKGSFTGAQGVRRGVFELANQGTLFLDEIGEASPSVQVKLLRTLESGEFFRVGGEQTIKADVRILAATNKNLRDAVRNKLFREDLLYRLDVVNLHIPPLRERRMDIEPLVGYFIEKNLPEEEKHVRIRFNDQAMTMLQGYFWPGNIRELSNVVASCLALRSSDLLVPECLPRHVVVYDEEEFLVKHMGTQTNIDEIVRDWSQRLLKVVLSKRTIDLMELRELINNETAWAVKQVVEETLSKTGNNRTEAAKLLNISPRVMRYLQNEKGS